MTKSGKVWGDTELLLQTPLVELSRIHIEPKSYCSLHRHHYKWNAFYIIAGSLEIVCHKNDYDLVDTTRLGPGDLCTMRPGEFHFFRSLDEPVVALELYYPASLSEDIERRNCGGTDAAV
jgi:mannose-6-phosphate isomerase-like protein (cupin superfamily)